MTTIAANSTIDTQALLDNMLRSDEFHRLSLQTNLNLEDNTSLIRLAIINLGNHLPDYEEVLKYKYALIRPKEFDGFLKLVFRKDDMKLMGVHAIGEIASEVVHIGLTAMMMGAKSELFIRTCFNYPTLGELYKYATYDAMGKRDS